MHEWSHEILSRLAGLNLSPVREAEIVEEVAQHLEDRYQELVAAGTREDEARRVALKELEEDLLTRGLRLVEQQVKQEPIVPGAPEKAHVRAGTWQDVRYGLRVLRKNLGFTVVAVLTLALGIGANTAIFSVVDAVLLRPLPFHDSSRLVQLWEKHSEPGTWPLTGPDYLDFQAQAQTLEGTSLFDMGESLNASGAGEPEPAYVIRTQANFFSLLGVTPLVGRTFAKGEDQAGRNNVAVLSYGFWERHFGGEKDAVGKALDLNEEKYTVVGVMPGWFRSLAEADIWVPMDMSPKSLGRRGQYQFWAIGRLKRGVLVAAAASELDTIAHRLEKQYPDSVQKGVVVVPLKEQLVGDSRSELLILQAAVGLVLLIACANVANLSLVRATGRNREIAVRQALGASRGRIGRQLLTESVLLSILSAVLGISIGWCCLRLLASAETAPIPMPNPITLNNTVLGFTLGIGVLVGIVVGLVPVLQVSQLVPNEELKTSVQAVLGPSGRRRILRDALVAGEIAISLALLVGSGLLLRSFAKLREVDLGIRPRGVLTAQIDLPPKKYSTMEQARIFYDQLVDGLKGAPGIEVAAVGSRLPLRGGSNGYVTIEGNENPAFEKILVEQNAITPDYFRVFGIPLLKGRNFSPQDSRETAESLRKVLAWMQSGQKPPLPAVTLVAVINQTMARQFWPNRNPLGRIFRLGAALPVTVIGIVGDVKEREPREAVIPQAYYPLTFELVPPVGTLSVVVRGTGGIGELAASVRSQVHALDSSLALFNVRTMQEIISQSMTDTSYQSLLLSTFALLALLLTTVGIYGVMAYAVTQRTHEIGLRLALGAHPREIMRLVLGAGARITFVGVALGVGGALALSRFLSSLLFGVQPRDPFTFVVVAALLSVVALSASYIPAHRATKVDPMAALRYE
jgi:putative ABC transport system permease protein